MPARLCLPRKCSRVDHHRENSVHSEGPIEGQSGMQLSPYYLPPLDVEAFSDGNYGRVVRPTYGEE